MATVTVVYPQGGDFDLEYYRVTHMPLVQKNWTEYGLKSYQITQLGPDAPYQIQATLQFTSVGDFQKAASSESAKTVLGDIENFTKVKPTIMAGEVIFTS